MKLKGKNIKKLNKNDTLTGTLNVMVIQFTASYQ